MNISNRDPITELFGFGKKKEQLKAVCEYAEETLGFTVCRITKT